MSRSELRWVEEEAFRRVTQSQKKYAAEGGWKNMDEADFYRKVQVITQRLLKCGGVCERY